MAARKIQATRNHWKWNFRETATSEFRILTTQHPHHAFFKTYCESIPYIETPQLHLGIGPTGF